MPPAPTTRNVRLPMATMTVSELVELLSEHDPDSPVMIAHQPAWPLAETMAGVIHGGDAGDDDDDEPIIWLVAGGPAWDRSPYAPSFVFAAAEVNR